MYLHRGPLPLLHEQDAAGHALHRQSFLAQLVHQRKKRYVLKADAPGNEDDNGKAPSSAPACTRVFSEQFRGIIKASHPHISPLRRASGFHHFDRQVVRQSSCACGRASSFLVAVHVYLESFAVDQRLGESLKGLKFKTWFDAGSRNTCAAFLPVQKSKNGKGDPEGPLSKAASDFKLSILVFILLIGSQSA